MTYRRGNQGFTMMEVMIVIAILGVMAALVFVNIVPFMKGFYQKEMDETAREIYVAAQNHLSIADSMGFLKGKSDGTPAGDDIYYFVVEKGGEAQSTASGGSTKPNGVNESTSVLSQMLPYGSIDDTVRLGGSYVISYSKKTARVVEVFYRNPSGRFDNGQSFKSANASTTYTGLQSYSGADKKEARLNYNNQEVIIGWYNGEGGGLSTNKLTAPKVRVENGDRLLVKVWWDSNGGDTSFTTGLNVGIIITGKTSGKHTPVLKLSPTAAGGLVYEGCLDDIASSYDNNKDQVLAKNNGHFAERFADWDLVPGEDVTISTFAYYSAAHDGSIYEVAKGPTVTTNSLFRSVGYEVGANGTLTDVREARISHIRHLENLSKEISGYDIKALDDAETARLSKNAGGTPQQSVTQSTTGT